MRIITVQNIESEMEMFDGFVDTQSEAADQLQVTFDCSGCNAIAIFNTYGLSATLTISVTLTEFPYELPIIFTSEMVYSQTVSLVRTSVKDWWDYFYATDRIGKDIVFYFEPREAAQATLTIDYTGGTARCGMCVKGVASECGLTGAGVDVGISDYSTIDTNSFGVSYLSVGTWAKRAKADVLAKKDVFQTAYDKIIENRGTPAVFDYNNYSQEIESGHSSQYGKQCLLLYGYAENFDPKIERPKSIIYGLEVQGLI